MTHYQIIGAQIKRVRKQRGLTQATLAERLGTTASDISDIERGQKSCSIDRYVAIAEELSAKLEINLTAEFTLSKS